MPNRYIREAAIKSKRVNQLSWQGEVFYRRMLNLADDFGRYSADPEILRVDVFPRQLDRVRESDLPRLLAECEKAELLYVYLIDDKSFMVMNQWEKGRAKSSDYPPPPENICKLLKAYVYTSKHKSTHASDSDSDSDTDSNTDPVSVSELGARIAEWFGRRRSTVWTSKERKALKIVEGSRTTPEDIDLLEQFYQAAMPEDKDWRRRDLVTLLNNWNGEIDKARRWQNELRAPKPSQRRSIAI